MRQALIIRMVCLVFSGFMDKDAMIIPDREEPDEEWL